MSVLRPVLAAHQKAPYVVSCGHRLALFTELPLRCVLGNSEGVRA
jgi:hypothetical protein